MRYSMHVYITPRVAGVIRGGMSELSSVWTDLGQPISMCITAVLRRIPILRIPLVHVCNGCLDNTKVYNKDTSKAHKMLEWQGGWYYIMTMLCILLLTYSCPGMCCSTCMHPYMVGVTYTVTHDHPYHCLFHLQTPMCCQLMMIPWLATAALTSSTGQNVVWVQSMEQLVVLADLLQSGALNVSP